MTRLVALAAMTAAVAAPSSAVAETEVDTIVLPTSAFHRYAIQLGTYDLAAPPVVRNLAVVNAGDDSLVLPRPTVESPFNPSRPPEVFALADESCSSAPLPPGGFCSVSVRLTPSTSRRSGTSLSHLVIRPVGGSVSTTRLTADVLHPTKLVALAGRGPLGLGAVRPGRTSPFKTVTLGSNGGYDLVPGAIAVEGPDADQFAIGANTCSGVLLKLRTRCTYDVRFAPTSPGPKTASLTIVGAGANPPHSTVAVEGTGLLTVTDSLRTLARRAGYRLAGPRLRQGLAKRRFSLGRHAWPAAGRVDATVELVVPGGGTRVLARGGPSAVLGTGRESVVVTVRRGARRALLTSKRASRAIVRLRLVEADGVTATGERRVPVRGGKRPQRR